MKLRNKDDGRVREFGVDETKSFPYIVGLMCVALLLAIAATIYEIINPSYEYERGYMDGFRNGMLMHDMDYGTIKLEREMEAKNE